MSKWLKIGAGIIVLIVLLAIISRVSSCVSAHRDGVSKIVTPQDSTFAPLEHRSYTPPSVQIPFLTKKKSGHPPASLPVGVSEKDVKRVISLKYKDRTEPVNIIEMKSGMIFVKKDSLLEEVTDWTYRPPIVEFGLFPGGGLSFAWQDSKLRLSPTMGFSLMDVCGTVRLPFISVDIDGLGAGIQAKLYHEIYIGPSIVWSFDDLSHKQIRISLNYNF